jgi:hypothetical protein
MLSAVASTIILFAVYGLFAMITGGILEVGGLDTLQGHAKFTLKSPR